MPSRSRSRQHWLIPAALAGVLLASAVFSKPFHIGAGHLAALAALYSLLALAIYVPALLALRWSPSAALPVVAAGAFVLALHVREQTRPSGTAESLDKPAVLALFLVAWALATAVYFLALLALHPGERQGTPVWALPAVVALLFGMLAVSYHGSDTLRWRLLRHNTLLGALSYHLFAPDTATVRAALWEASADGGGERATHSGAPAAGGPPNPSAAGTEPAPDAARAPNLVFVLVDTLRADALAATGGTRGSDGTGGTGGPMPRLDELAARSRVFADVKVNAPWTFPSMASFFTGLLPEEHGAVWGGELGEDRLTIAEALAARGYRTAAFSGNAAWMRADRGMAQGFEVFEQLGPGGSIYPRAAEINAAAFDWLEQRRPGPAFLYVHYMDPHVPYLTAGVVDPADHDEAFAAYERDLAYLDEHLAELVERVAATLEGPTWVLVTADHGEEFGEHGERGHGRALYDEVLRVPALLHRVGEDDAAVLTEPLEGRDFFHLLDALATDAGLDVSAWARAHARTRRYAASYYTNRSWLYRLLRPYRADVCLRVLEADGYTLIWSGQGNTFELYDLRTDPGQLDNIAAQHPEVVERLAAAMRAEPSFWAPRSDSAFSPEDLERLRALGYLR